MKTFHHSIIINHLEQTCLVFSRNHTQNISTFKTDLIENGVLGYEFWLDLLWKKQACDRKKSFSIT